jgi:hypothetical protein
VTRDELSAWVDAYERAWRSPGTDALRELFADDATYRMAPFQEPTLGLPAIVALWERERDGPEEEFTLEWEIVAAEGAVGVVRTDVRYLNPLRHWRNLWIVRFDDEGRCAAFEEWAFAPPRRRKS